MLSGTGFVWNGTWAASFVSYNIGFVLNGMQVLCGIEQGVHTVKIHKQQVLDWCP